MTTIQSDRLYMRNLIASDLKDLIPMLKSEKVMQYTSFKRSLEDDEIAVHFNKWLNDPEVWTCLDHSEYYLGWFMLKSRAPHCYELGFMLAENQWGNGYASEASKALIDYAYKYMKVERVEARVRIENIHSIRTIEKLGFIEMNRDQELINYEKKLKEE